MNAKVRNNSERLADLHEVGVDWETRTVWIVGDLLDGKAYKYVPALMMLDETPGPIKVVIMSVGGDEGGGFAIFDTIRSLKNDVVTIALGHCYSIAALIFQAGDKRLMAENAELMMHNGTLELGGGDMESDKIKELAKEATRNDHRYHAAITRRTGVALNTVRIWCKTERYFSAHEAVRLGLADAVAGAKDLR